MKSDEFAMIKQLLSNRSTAPEAIEKMSRRDLLRYVESRLKKTQLRPALDNRTDELPSLVLEKTYERSTSEDFRERFRDAVAELLTREQLGIHDNDYVSYLLLFCEKYKIESATAPLAGMLASGILRDRKSINRELHKRALMAFSRLPRGMGMTDIWVDAIDDIRYTAASFAALNSKGVEVLAEYLPKFLEMSVSEPSALNLKAAMATVFACHDEESRRDISRKLLQGVDARDHMSASLLRGLLAPYDPPRDSGVISKDERETPRIQSIVLEAATQLFNHGDRDLAERLLAESSYPIAGTYIFGLLNLQAGERDEAINLFTAAFEAGLSTKDAAWLQERLPRGPSPRDLKRLLMPVLTAIKDSDPILRSRVAAQLILSVERERNNFTRIEKWTKVEDQLDEPAGRVS